jgi:hypothetical protein
MHGERIINGMEKRKNLIQVERVYTWLTTSSFEQIKWVQKKERLDII